MPASSYASLGGFCSVAQQSDYKGQVYIRAQSLVILVGRGGERTKEQYFIDLRYLSFL